MMRGIAWLPLHSFQRQFAAVWWKELRRLPKFAGVSAIALLALYFTGLLLRFPCVIAMCFTTVCGLMTFQPEQENNNVRFFSERGVSSRFLWITKTAFWLLPVVGAGMLLPVARMLAGSAVDFWPAYGEPRELMVRTIILLQAAFFVGLFYSIAYRHRPNGWAMGIVTLGLLFGWCKLLVSVPVSLVAGVGPIAVGAFFGSVLCCQPWMHLRDTFRFRWASIVCLLSGIFVAWLLPAVGRVLKVPSPVQSPIAIVRPDDSDSLWPSGSAEPFDQPIVVTGYGQDELRLKNELRILHGQWKNTTEHRQQHLALAQRCLEHVRDVNDSTVDWLIADILTHYARHLAREGRRTEAADVYIALASDAERPNHLYYTNIAQACCYGGYTKADIGYARNAISKLQRDYATSESMLADGDREVLAELQKVEVPSEAFSKRFFLDEFRIRRIYDFGVSERRRILGEYRNQLTKGANLSDWVSGSQANKEVADEFDELVFSSEYASHAFLLFSNSNPWRLLKAETDSITNARLANAFLDVAAYVLEHKEYPELIERRNPWSGLPMTWFPNGATDPDSPGTRYDSAFIWCTAMPYNSYEKASRELRAQSMHFIPEGVTTLVTGKAVSDDELRREGHLFPSALQGSHGRVENADE